MVRNKINSKYKTINTTADQQVTIEEIKVI